MLECENVLSAIKMIKDQHNSMPVSEFAKLSNSIEHKMKKFETKTL